MLSRIKFPALGITIGFLLSYIAIKAPAFHLQYLRNRVGSAVTMLVILDGRGGGSGFQVSAPSGNKYIVTNKHVCEGSDALLAINNNETSFHKIIARSDRHDICILEPSNLLNTIRLGNDPDVGDQIAIIGHPMLTPMQVSRGEINGFNRAIQLPFMHDLNLDRFLSIYWTSAASYPGNSGSPVVDFYGNVVGILFAGMGDHINMIVPVSAVKEFLKDK